MDKEQLEIKQEPVEQDEKLTIKEEPCFLKNISNIEENLQIKKEPIDNDELDFNPDKNMIIKEEFSETFVKFCYKICCQEPYFECSSKEM